MKRSAGTGIRAVTADILFSVLEKGALSHLALRDALGAHDAFSREDKAWITRVTEGTLEKTVTLDYALGFYSRVPVKKMQPYVRTVLRMSFYQLFFMDGVPDYAVCDEAVRLIRRRVSNLSGFVNGVLRSAVREPDKWRLPDRERDPVRYAEIRGSLPEWIAQLWLREFGEAELLRLAETEPESRSVVIRVNESRIDVSALRQRLRVEGAETEPVEGMTAALKLARGVSPAALPAYREGLFCIQNPASMLVCTAAGIRPGTRVLDLCAAPGGKSLHAADLMRGEGEILACDKSEGKVKQIRENAARCGFDIVRSTVNDAALMNPAWEAAMDTVIADLPCSGLGDILAKPDLRYRLRPEDIGELAALQRRMLAHAVSYVRPGGTLVFSTCTVTREENEENREFLLSRGLVPVSLVGRVPDRYAGAHAEEGFLQLLPCAEHDGFYLAVFEKRT